MIKELGDLTVREICEKNIKHPRHDDFVIYVTAVRCGGFTQIRIKEEYLELKVEVSDED